MNITGEDLILACSAIGAGLAVIAGIGPVLDRVLQQVTVQQPWVETRAHRERSCQPCYLDRQLPRQQVCMDFLLPCSYFS